MSNIHRINDYSNQNNQQQQYYGYNNIQSNPELDQQVLNLPLFGVRRDDGGDPRKETVFKMCVNTCCPTFSWRQFIVIITIVEVVLFIITLACSKHLQDDFLSPQKSILIDFGANVPEKVKEKGQIHRLVLAILLHASFLHIFNNMFFQLIFGIQLESTIGLIQMIILYIGSGIGGNLFSAFIHYQRDDNVYGVGASTSLNGLLAAYLGFLIVNWTVLKVLGPFIYKFACIIFLIAFLNLVPALVATDSDIDKWGHLGGFLSGFFISLAILTPIRKGPREERIKRLGIALTFLFFLGFLLGLFLG